MPEVYFGVGDELIENAGDVLAVVSFLPPVVEIIDQAKQFLVFGINDVIADRVLV